MKVSNARFTATPKLYKAIAQSIKKLPEILVMLEATFGPKE